MIIEFVQNLKILPRWVIIFIDLFFIGFSCILGYLLRFNFNTTDFAANNYWEGTALYLVLALVSILVTDSYKGIIRYTGLEDGARIFYMVILNMVLVALANLIYYYNYKENIIPYSVILITFLSSFLLLFNYRLLVKQIFSYYKDAILKNFRVIIFGAGQTGIVTRHVINSTPRMQVIGFLEDDINKVGKVLDGARIYNARSEELNLLLKNLNIDELVITVKEISLDRKNELVDVCIRNKVKVRTIPAVEKWVRGELSFSQIREINIEELLGRESIKLDNENVKKDLAGKRVLISGAAGSIGAELVRQVVLYNPSLIILVDQAESAMYEIEREIKDQNGLIKIIPYLADITNAERLEYIFKEYQPDRIYHAAAYKHVPMMESNPSEAISCNILGTKLLADMAVKYRVKKFVMISTDKAVNPTNVMGCSKRIAEIYVQSLSNHLAVTGASNTVFVTTRFGNVLGSNGSVIPLFKKQIKERGPVTVTHPEITRYFMTIPEACQLVLEAGTIGKGGEIFIFDMGKAVKILDLAKKMIRLSGYEPDRDIPIVFTGIREGEKLYEELLTTTENTLPTHHAKIMIAKVQEYQFTEINKFVDLFHDLVYDKNELKMVALMKELVPEYKSNYSRYEILDKQSEGV
ncbi:MAG TPA: nucleoside-diphosphate sugar epimerase/dehydratase [Cyclobacteriaceae bacterium]|nr:nucleoside-diphosphate sugar epimerase/dehydratase [Cyclobacteriaceae bacterium]